VKRFRGNLKDFSVNVVGLNLSKPASKSPLKPPSLGDYSFFDRHRQLLGIAPELPFFLSLRVYSFSSEEKYYFSPELLDLYTSWCRYGEISKTTLTNVTLVIQWILN